MPALIALLRLVVDVLLSRRLEPAETTPTAHPLGPREGEPVADPLPPVPSPEPSPPVAPPADDGHVPPGLAPVLAAMRRLEYRIFDRPEGGDLNLNIVAVRNPAARLDGYDCELLVFWRRAGAWQLERWPITTYPGSRYLVEKLLSPKGAAILCPGQYLGVYRLDLHNGRYRALCQRNGAVSVYRDGDRDRVFDLHPSTIQKGSFGINVHASQTPSGSNQGHVAERVYASSAGCLVFQRMADFLAFRELCEAAAELHGNQFSLTLLTRDDLDPATAAPLPPQSAAAAGSDWHPSGYDTVGVRNRNLLNVKGEDWLYSMGRDARGHNIFPTHAKGLRAGIITLRSYWTRHGKRSIAAILARWAPASDTVGSLPGGPPNSPLAYSRFVAGRMQVDATATLALFHDDGRVRDASQLYSLVAAMVEYENGAGLRLPRAVFDEALAMV